MSLIRDTLFAKYIFERKGLSILEDENFFIFYKACGEELFIEDMSVDLAVRAIGKGKSAIGQLVEIAKQNNCKEITANIHLWDSGCNNTLAAALLTGFEVRAANNNILLISKSMED